MCGITVREFLDLIFEDGLPNGYYIYDFNENEYVYKSSDESKNDLYEWLGYEVVSFDITERGVLEINIDTME